MRHFSCWVQPYQAVMETHLHRTGYWEASLGAGMWNEVRWNNCSAQEEETRVCRRHLGGNTYSSHHGVASWKHASAGHKTLMAPAGNELSPVPRCAKVWNKTCFYPFVDLCISLWRGQSLGAVPHLWDLFNLLHRETAQDMSAKCQDPVVVVSSMERCQSSKRSTPTSPLVDLQSLSPRKMLEDI